MEKHEARHQYAGIFWALAVLTLVEVGVVFAGLPRLALIALLGLFAVAKAALVALYFMHLRFEPWVVWAIGVSPLGLTVAYATVLALGVSLGY